jgi:hypothetical protein
MQEHLIERVPALMWPSSRASAKRLKAIQDTLDSRVNEGWEFVQMTPELNSWWTIDQLLLFRRNK